MNEQYEKQDEDAKAGLANELKAIKQRRKQADAINQVKTQRDDLFDQVIVFDKSGKGVVVPGQVVDFGELEKMSTEGATEGATEEELLKKQKELTRKLRSYVGKESNAAATYDYKDDEADKYVQDVYGLTENDYDKNSQELTYGNILYWNGVNEYTALKSMFLDENEKKNLIYKTYVQYQDEMPEEELNRYFPTPPKYYGEFDYQKELDSHGLLDKKGKIDSQAVYKYMNDYAENYTVTKKRNAELLGYEPRYQGDESYYENIYVPQMDFKAYGYQYDLGDSEDFERMQKGLPPKSFLKEYEDTPEDKERLKTGRVPKRIEEEDSRKTAELLGIKPSNAGDTEYFKDIKIIVADWESLGYQYDKNDPQDMERYRKGLPPKSFLIEYTDSPEDRERLKSGRLPEHIEEQIKTERIRQVTGYYDIDKIFKLDIPTNEEFVIAVENKDTETIKKYADAYNKANENGTVRFLFTPLTDDQQKRLTLATMGYNHVGWNNLAPWEKNVIGAMYGMANAFTMGGVGSGNTNALNPQKRKQAIYMNALNEAAQKDVPTAFSIGRTLGGGPIMDLLAFPGLLGKNAVQAIIDLAQGKNPEWHGSLDITGWKDESQTIDMLKQIFGDSDFLNDPRIALLANMGGDILLDPTTWIGVGLAAKEAKAARAAKNVNTILKEQKEIDAANTMSKSPKDLKVARNAESELAKTASNTSRLENEASTIKKADILDYMNLDRMPRDGTGIKAGNYLHGNTTKTPDIVTAYKLSKNGKLLDESSDIARLNRYVDQSKLNRVANTLSKANEFEKLDNVSDMAKAAGNTADAARVGRLAEKANVLDESFKLKLGNNAEKIVGSDAKKISFCFEKAGQKLKDGDLVAVTSKDGNVVRLERFDSGIRSKVMAPEEGSVVKVYEYNGVGYNGKTPSFTDLTSDIAKPQATRYAIPEGGIAGDDMGVMLREKSYAPAAGKEGGGGEYTTKREMAAEREYDAITPDEKDIVDQAKALQRDAGYQEDSYKITNLTKGEKVYGLTPGQSFWFTDLESVEKAGYSYKELYEGLQIAVNEDYGYRKTITVYEVLDDFKVATGTTSANKTIIAGQKLTYLGDGGLFQYVIPDFKVRLKPVKAIKLHE
jgi:hypothetical protein